MNTLDVLIGLYGKLHNYKGIPFWILTPFRKILRAVSNAVLPKYLERYSLKSPHRSISVIVSLTSFPDRINSVWQVIVCMQKQTMPPRKIILWLSKEQFPSIDSIPDKLKTMENETFQIRLVEGDIRSHKKYYYVAKEYPNDLIFLIDDDIYYPTDILERSYDAYLKHPNCVVCNYGYRITYDQLGKHKRYSDWVSLYKGSEGRDLVFGSGGGTLLNPLKMHHDFLSIDKATKLTPLADDIWLNAMARLAGLDIFLLPGGLILDIKTDSERLSSKNNGQSQNDVQLANIERCYGRCFDKQN